MGVLPVYMSLHYVCVVPPEAGREHQILLNTSGRWLLDTAWVLGSKRGSPAANCWTSLQSLSICVLARPYTAARALDVDPIPTAATDHHYRHKSR